MPITAGQIAFGIDADHIETKTLALAQAYLFASGSIDGGGLTSFEIPNSAAPTVDANGEIAVDTSVTDFSHGILKYFGGEEMAVIAVPIAQLTSPTNGHVVKYNSTNDEFELGAVAGGIGGSTGATDNAILRADGTGGATVQSSGASIDDSGFITSGGASSVRTVVLRDLDGNNLGAIYSGAATVGVGNYALAFDSTQTYLNAASALEFRSANATIANITADGLVMNAKYIGGSEQTAPSAPAANGFRIFAQDNGSGKTQLMVIFSSGASQQIAIEP